MKSTVCLASAVFASTIFLGVANASGPIGVYALVEKVSFEPGADKPDHIRISGVFITALPKGDNSTVYSAPQRGYLYFALPKGKEELALREWADLKSVVGTHQVVGFGSSWGTKAYVRKPDEQTNVPGDYPMGNGMVRINSDQPNAMALLNYKE